MANQPDPDPAVSAAVSDPQGSFVSNAWTHWSPPSGTYWATVIRYAEYENAEGEPPYDSLSRWRAPHVRARDEPPDPTASGPSTLDMEDWYATNGWRVWPYRDNDPVAGKRYTAVLPVETAIEREVAVLRKAHKKRVMRRRVAKAQARWARRTAAAAAAAAQAPDPAPAQVSTGNQASLRGGGGGHSNWDWDFGDGDGDDDDDDFADDGDETIAHNADVVSALLTPVRRGAGTIASASPSTDGDGNPAQYLHTADDPPLPPPRPSFGRGAPSPTPAPADLPPKGKYTFGVEFEFLLATRVNSPCFFSPPRLAFFVLGAFSVSGTTIFIGHNTPSCL